MNLCELSAYLLPVVMLIFVTLGSLSPYLMNKRRRKKNQADDSIADEKKVREVSYELVTSIPSSDNGKGIDYGRILGTLRILEQERESELRAYMSPTRNSLKRERSEGTVGCFSGRESPRRI